MKKLVFFSIVFCFCNPIIAQHFGGIYLSAELIPTEKSSRMYEKVGNLFNDLNFSNGYTIGYQGLLMEKRRFSFTYGLQFSYVSAISNYIDLPAIGGSINNSSIAFEVGTSKEKVINIEIPIGIRYNILKGSKFQPYISINIIFICPLWYDIELRNRAGKEIYYGVDEDFKLPLNGNVELAIGLNYKTNKYIFDLHPFFRPRALPQGKFGVGLAILRKY